jgi:hypothetical protein
MSFNLTIAWKASPTRTPPPICTSTVGPQTALVWRAAGAASTLRDTAWLGCRNENDSERVPAKSTSHSQNQATAPMRGGKVLNLCEDSKCRTAVIFLAAAQNKFTNCLRSSRSKLDFQTTDRRYADKWLRKRVFFCSSEQGNPAAPSDSAARSRLQFRKCARSIPGARFSSRSGFLSPHCCVRPVYLRGAKHAAGKSSPILVWRARYDKHKMKKARHCRAF